MDLESDQAFNCPYCSASISIRIDRTGGRRQYFVTDCEVCCRPISIEVDMDPDGFVNFIAKRCERIMNMLQQMKKEVINEKIEKTKK